jgi:hypothetical protein
VSAVTALKTDSPVVVGSAKSAVYFFGCDPRRGDQLIVAMA